MAYSLEMSIEKYQLDHFPLNAKLTSFLVRKQSRSIFIFYRRHTIDGLKCRGRESVAVSQPESCLLN
jgi:hypothetical protein